MYVNTYKSRFLALCLFILGKLLGFARLLGLDDKISRLNLFGLFLLLFLGFFFNFFN